MLQCQKAYFDLEPDIHYLNGAAYSPQLRTAAQRMESALRIKTSMPFAISEAHHFETADSVRRSFSEMLYAEDPLRIAIIPAVSYGLATAAVNLQRWPGIGKKRTIIMVQDEFPNNVYAFQRISATLGLAIQTIPLPADSDFAAHWNEKLLASIEENTALVVVQPVHWMYGVRFDMAAISRRCRENNVMLIVDGSQSTGVLPFNISEIQPDLYISATYKWLLGVYGIALAYFGPFFDEGIPLEENWLNRANSADFTRLTQYTDQYRPLAQRYNTGEFSHFFQLPILDEALRQINMWGVSAIQAYSESLTGPLNSALSAAGYRIPSPAYRAGHLTGIRMPAGTRLAELLDLLKAQRVYVSVRGEILRLSVHVYNDADDLEALRSCLLV